MPAPPLWVVSYEGPQPYRPLWDLQNRLRAQRQAGRIPDTLLLLEHAPVVTLGRNARRENLLLDPEMFRRRGVEVVEVDRGGDVTYHGPGQLVGYWIFDLRALYQDAHRYLREIEETLIRTLRRHGIGAGRSAGATGVWTGFDAAGAGGAKIAAMGLHLSHWVSTHGFALNMGTDLDPFGWIVPCGLRGRAVTSMARLLGAAPARERVEADLVAEAAALFDRAPVALEPHELADILMELERRPQAGAGAAQVDAPAPGSATAGDAAEARERPQPKEGRSEQCRV